jgi:hypothetical protein
MFMVILLIASIFESFYHLRQSNYHLANFKYKLKPTVDLRLIEWLRLRKRKLRRAKRKNKRY